MASSKKGLLLAVAGLSGTGKSTLAGRLSKEFNKGARPVEWLRNDVIRKELAGVPVTEKLSEEFYSSAFSQKTYAEFDRRLKEGLRKGHVMIADGVFSGEARRRELEGFAQEVGAKFAGIWLDAPAAIMKARADARKGDASDADSKVIEMQLRFKKGTIDWLRVDASGTPDDTYDKAAKALKKHGIMPVPRS
jgi:predicted kinase